jgi:hypothetical protein
MAFEFDAATAGDEHSIAGQRVELNGKPYAGFPEITGGGTSIEGQNYVRGSDGRILFLSRGIKTPQDLESKCTLGAFKILKADLVATATLLGITGDEAWMDVAITIVLQSVSGNPLAPPFEETMILSVMAAKPERTADGSGWMMGITWKQHVLPTMN